MDNVIKSILEQRAGSMPQTSSGLTPQDLFYREVSKIHEFLETLMEHEERMLLSEITPIELISLVINVTKILSVSSRQ